MGPKAHSHSPSLAAEAALGSAPLPSSSTFAARASEAQKALRIGPFLAFRLPRTTYICPDTPPTTPSLTPFDDSRQGPRSLMVGVGRWQAGMRWPGTQPSDSVVA